MIVGARLITLAKEIIPEKCKNCGQSDSVEVRLMQEYIHFIFIPIFPSGKKPLTQCKNCGLTLSGHGLYPSLWTEYNRIKSQYKRKIPPLWTFAGTAAIILIAIPAVIISEKQRQARNARLILEPRVNDIYEVEVENDYYTLYKVGKVVKDSVFIYPNTFQINQKTALHDIENKPYSDEPFVLMKDELKKMVDKDDIFDIRRND